MLGQGESVVVIQTALDADELLPLAEHIAATRRYQAISYHRRGYAGSGPTGGTPSIERDAADCRRLLAVLAATPAHVVGASYSAAVALTLAATASESVRTVTVIEPPPVHVPSGPEFRAANLRLLATFHAAGAPRALEEFLTMLIGPGWRQDLEHHRAGSVAALERDAVTFFEHDLPALLSWRFSAEDARRIACPVLYLGGSDSGPWFAQVRTHILGLLPDAEHATVAGAGHLLAATHPAETATIVSHFLDRHSATTTTG